MNIQGIKNLLELLARGYDQTAPPSVYLQFLQEQAKNLLVDFDEKPLTVDEYFAEHPELEAKPWRHDWKDIPQIQDSILQNGPGRKCSKCGATQYLQPTGYDLQHKRIFKWEPKIGKCRGYQAGE